MPLCPDCETQVSEDTRFCHECGHQIAAAQSTKRASRGKIAGIIAGCMIGTILVAILAAPSSSRDMAPLPPPEPGWVRLQFQDVGSIDYPPDFLELQSEDYRRILGEFYTAHEIQSSDFTLQQTGFNELRPSALEEYRRVMFTTSYMAPDERVFRLNDRFTMSEWELAEIRSVLTRQLAQDWAELERMGLGSIHMVDAGSIEVREVNRMFPLVWTYVRQLDDNPEVLVRLYMFFNYDRIHHLTFSYRVQDAEQCEDVYAKILNSLRLQ